MDETISSRRTLGLIAGCLLLGQSVGAQSAERPATDPPAGLTAPAVVELRPVLVGPDKNSNVWPSPDGRWLAFTDPESGNLGVRSIPAGRDSLITHFASGTTIATGPAWSPDGLRLAYYWIDRVSKSTALRVVGRDGAVERIVYQKDGQYVEPWGWTPDGRQIVVSVRGEADPPRFALVSLDGVPIRFIKTVVTPYFVSLAVSPDGQYLAYDRPKETGSEDTDIFTLRIDGSSEVAVIEHPARDRLLGWMSDGRSLLFTSPRRKNVGSIWSVAVTEGRAAAPPELVRGAPANFEPLGVTRTGSLFYRLSTVMRDVYTASYDPTTGKAGRAELADAHDLSANTTGPDWSADGKYLLYQADVAGTGGHGSQLTIVSLSDGQRRQITPSVSDYSRPRWHPGGLSIVAHGAHLGEHGVYGIDATTGEAKSLESYLVARWQDAVLRAERPVRHDAGAGRRTA